MNEYIDGEYEEREQEEEQREAAEADWDLYMWKEYAEKLSVSYPQDAEAKAARKWLGY